MHRAFSLLIVLAAAGLLLPSASAQDGPGAADRPAGAQDSTAAAGRPAGNIHEEIVVTARRREENVQEIPISMTTFDEASLEDRSIVEIDEIGHFTPNLSIATTGGFAFQSNEIAIFMRGVGQLDTALFSDPAVGLYVDGVFLARAQGGVLDLVDVERVEVLRGPQGTLFGKNTTGGAISLVTKRPGNELAGRLSGTVGSYDRRDARVSVAGPFSESLHASLGVLSSNRDGFSRSLTSGVEYNDDNRDSARAALHWQPSDHFTVQLTGDFMAEREVGSNQLLLSLTPTPLLQFYDNAQSLAGLPPADPALWPATGFYDTHSTTPSYVDQDAYGSALVASWLVSRSLSVQSITSHRGFDVDHRGDLDGLPNAVADVQALEKSDQLSQEVQLSGVTANDRFQWVLGGLYFREVPRAAIQANIMLDLFPALEQVPGALVAPPGVPAFLCDPGPPPPGVLCFGGAGNPLNLAFVNGFGGFTTNDLETESTAVFAEGTYDVGDKLSLTLGVRYSRDDKSFAYLSTDAFGNVGAELFAADAWDAVTPRFSLAYQARPDVMFYFTAANGYKSGGFNGRPQNRGVLDPFDPETVWSYEAGWKSDLAGNRLRLNGAAFFSDYDDIHFAASLDVDGMPVFVTQNAGRAEITGFEVELDAYPVPGLNLSAGVGYTDTDLVEVDPRVPIDLEAGVRLPKTPEWSVNAALQYAFDLQQKGALIARADYSYSTKVYNDLANVEAIAQGAFGLVNARLTYTTPSGNWDVAGFVTNLTDEEYLGHGFFAAAFGFNIGVAGRPQEWGLTAQWRF